MKRLNLNMVLVLLLAAFALASCQKESKSAQLIPSDALVVMRWDVKQTLQKSKATESNQLKEKLYQKLEENKSVPDGMRAKLKAIIDDPANSGVDFTQPFFLAMSGDVQKNPTFSFIGSLNDAGKLADLLKEAKDQGIELQEKDGIQYIQAGGDAYFAFNEDNFIFNGGNKSAGIDAVIALFSNTDNALIESEEFKKMNEAKGFLQFMFRGEAMAKIMESAPKEATANLPEDFTFEGMGALVDLNTEKGKAILDCEIIATNDFWKDYLKQSIGSYEEIDGDAVEYLTKGGFALLAGINGENCAKMMEKYSKNFNGLLSEEQFALLLKVMSSIDGDIAVSVTGMTEGNPKPVIAAYLETKDNSLLTELQNNGINVNELGAKSGFDKGFSYVTFGVEPFTESANPVGNEYKDKMLYCSLDVNFLSGALSSFGFAGQAKAVASVVSSFELYYAENNKSSFVANFVDDTKDPLELLFSVIMTQL